MYQSTIADLERFETNDAFEPNLKRNNINDPFKPVLANGTKPKTSITKESNHAQFIAPFTTGRNNRIHFTEPFMSNESKHIDVTSPLAAGGHDTDFNAQFSFGDKTRTETSAPFLTGSNARTDFTGTFTKDESKHTPFLAYSSMGDKRGAKESGQDQKTIHKSEAVDEWIDNLDPDSKETSFSSTITESNISFQMLIQQRLPRIVIDVFDGAPE